ncbi:VIT1/CCC1 family predicted Fe2+/Mn2+ transporter [Naumannella cuiyingiana]|uniref:VIT1/CCC1 family predicted Fe2+/Mn2+ transporter n=1 Tax=Naumannella cuiyingiana TaxID=1347891 RepID=A0A7Z0D9E3_9ACTN|nr:VIT family protein [Naumannella cuiyingiana]NYI71175.1 VIT1/CCC1 family predicted Fe2+/Mn2+ transporter [Naumannella cuiyingiana]
MSTTHPGEPHVSGWSSRLNWLRAGVLGANDGIVSVAGIVMAAAGATTDTAPIAIAGGAGLVAGALSMAVGEYVSVSTQRDSERALLRKERRELAELPEAELDELAAIYRDKGLSEKLAREVAVQLTAHDALGAHAEAELGIDPDELARPWQAAFASLISFTVGALLPLLAILLPPPSWRIAVTVGSVVLALLLTGWISARLGRAPRARAIARNIGGGCLAMAISYGVGTLIGHAI